MLTLYIKKSIVESAVVSDSGERGLQHQVLLCDRLKPGRAVLQPAPFLRKRVCFLFMM